jgi:hypothetical protein
MGSYGGHSRGNRGAVLLGPRRACGLGPNHLAVAAFPRGCAAAGKAGHRAGPRGVEARPRRDGTGATMEWVLGGAAHDTVDGTLATNARSELKRMDR